jgi:hypothetical protein
MSTNGSFGRDPLPFGGALLLAIAAGCGPGKAEVTGKVTVDGQAAGGALVVFSSPGGRSASAPIDKNGYYRAADVPTEQVKVCIIQLAMTAAPDPDDRTSRTAPLMPTGQKPRSPVVTIPVRYTKVDSSGLTFTVGRGTNEYDIELTSR